MLGIRVSFLLGPGFLAGAIGFRVSVRACDVEGCKVAACVTRSPVTKNTYLHFPGHGETRIHLGLSPCPGCQSPPGLFHFLVGNPYKPSFVTVTGRGDNPRYT